MTQAISFNPAMRFGAGSPSSSGVKFAGATPGGSDSVKFQGAGKEAPKGNRLFDGGFCSIPILGGLLAGGLGIAKVAGIALLACGGCCAVAVVGGLFMAKKAFGSLFGGGS